MSLVPITEKEYGVRLDIRYATANNFTGKPVYDRGLCFLHREAAEKLKRAIELARNLGYQMLIFDAYRPTEAQQMLWNHTPDPDFLANPERGSPHSRGVAVDLTLLDKSGNELDMGTPFDAFTPLSHHGNNDITTESQKNRLILLGIMTLSGWDFYRNEWWHYQLFNSRDYPLISNKESGTNLLNAA